jgi:hypothetical protein
LFSFQAEEIYNRIYEVRDKEYSAVIEEAFGDESLSSKVDEGKTKVGEEGLW